METRDSFIASMEVFWFSKHLFNCISVAFIFSFSLCILFRVVKRIQLVPLFYNHHSYHSSEVSEPLDLLMPCPPSAFHLMLPPLIIWVTMMLPHAMDCLLPNSSRKVITVILKYMSNWIPGSHFEGLFPDSTITVLFWIQIGNRWLTEISIIQGGFYKGTIY